MKAEEIATTSSFSTVHCIETSEVRTSNSENNSNSDLINVKKNTFKYVLLN